MTRKEKEKLLLDELGLKVGDKIEMNGITLGIEDYGDQYALTTTDDCYYSSISHIIENDFEKIKPKPKKKLGEMRCKDFKKCKECPLYFFVISVCQDYNATLFKKIENLNEDKKLYDLMYKRLDVEVEE